MLLALASLVLLPAMILCLDFCFHVYKQPAGMWNGYHSADGILLREETRRIMFSRRKELFPTSLTCVSAILRPCMLPCLVQNSN